MKPEEQKTDKEDKLWLLVRNPEEYGHFRYENIGNDLLYSIFQNNENGTLRAKVRDIREGQYVVGYYSAPIKEICAFLKIKKASDGKNVTFESIEFLDKSCRIALNDDVFPKRGTLVQWIREISTDEYRKIVKQIREKQIPYPHNQIFYGAPGTGKSYLLNQQTSIFPEKQKERITFHPEYSYFDFVGSYKPITVNKKIEYRFTPGPFARMLKKALSKDNTMNEVPHLLLIEEINRARVAAVFGDMFQLLDRRTDGKSEYFITPSKDLIKYLTTDDADGEGITIPNNKLYLPSNFYIWATMNSADQGVFPMDTAFKRRWSFNYIPIDNGKKNEAFLSPVEKRWYELRQQVNDLLQEAGINEDKQMGIYFLSKSELSSMETFKQAFAEKVITYLYEDAARHHRSIIFKNSTARYEELRDDFLNELDGSSDIFMNLNNPNNS